MSRLRKREGKAIGLRRLSPRAEARSLNEGLGGVWKEFMEPDDDPPPKRASKVVESGVPKAADG